MLHVEHSLLASFVQSWADFLGDKVLKSLCESLQINQVRFNKGTTYCSLSVFLSIILPIETATKTETLGARPRIWSAEILGISAIICSGGTLALPSYLNMAFLR